MENRLGEKLSTLMLTCTAGSHDNWYEMGPARESQRSGMVAYVIGGDRWSGQHIAVAPRRTVDDAATILQNRRMHVRLSELENEVFDLKQLAYRGGVVLPVDSLAPHALKVTKTIQVHVRFEDDCYLACFIDANVNESGESEVEAIEFMKDRIASMFEFYTENEADLGKEPQRQLCVLREFIERR